MIDDIGTLIFSQLLGMTQYPGQPFTGNLFRDLIMFLIVPTIFIILVVYSIVGRIAADPKLRIMLGVGVYLFVIAGGYYPVFALLAGPYFIFLILVVGLLYFFMGHFTSKKPQSSGGGGAGFTEDYKNSRFRTLMGIPEVINPADVKYLKQKLAHIDARIKAVEKNIETVEKHPGTGDIGRLNTDLIGLVRERQEIEEKLGIHRN